MTPDNKQFAYAVLAEKLPKQYNDTIAVTMPLGLSTDLHQLIYITYVFKDTGVRTEDGKAVVMLYDIRFATQYYSYPLDVFKLNLTTPTTGNQTAPGFKITYKNYDHVNARASTRIPPPQYVVIYSDTNNRTKTPPGPRIKPAKGKS
jgi:hypothetical protein